MKKLIIMALLAAFAVAPTFAQKVNIESIEKELSKSDADIADEKKSEKYATWLTRAEVYFNSIYSITKSIFTGVDETNFMISMGKPESEGEVTINNQTFKTYEYPYVTVYFLNGKVASWESKVVVSEGAFETALEALDKAYAMNEKSAKKVYELLDLMGNYLVQEGENAHVFGKYKEAADAFVKVYDVRARPAYNDAEVTTLFSAGYLYTMAGATDASAYNNAIETLERAISLGYLEVEDANTEMADESHGDIYYYLFHCYYGTKESNPENLTKAKNILLEGIQAYPRNSNILETLMSLYTSEDGVGDPRELLELVEKSIADDPTNPDLWFGRGRIYNALKEYDECIASFAKYVELLPDSFSGYYFLGLFHAHKGDQISDEVNAKSYTSQSEYNADLEMVNAAYAGALAPLEKAFELDSNSFSTVAMLKSIYFRLRDYQDGFMDKYTKYNELFKSMEQ
ncbi:MAG: tetratricopeptide repeat protein [Rikenellaceae bacterium]